MGLDFNCTDHIAEFIINNPESRNALNYSTLTQFEKAVDIFNNDSELRVGIISGAGNAAFCSGIDLKNSLDRENWSTFPLTLMKGLETNKPLIAAINGPALGGGLELALVCDIRIASNQAIFGFPEVKLGLIPAWGGTQRIVHQISWANACGLVFSGNPINAGEALRIGLVNQVVNPQEVMSTARQWAEKIARAAPLAVQAAKEAMLKGSRLPLDEGLQLEDALFCFLKTTSDFSEGIEAFREHRDPLFKNR